MDNLKIYNAVRSVPKEALKEIAAGRLRGKSDINPMWRIKALTEQFGVCGFGWKYIIRNKHLESCETSKEISAFVDIDLYIKIDGEWSDAIPGTGGSSFVAQEKNGPYMSDECFKMALTDAISVACKSLGIGADVYWGADSSKYQEPPQSNAQLQAKYICADCNNEIKPTTKKTLEEIIAGSQKFYKLDLCQPCISKRYKADHPEAAK